MFRLHFFFKVIANRNCLKKDSQKVYDLYMNIYKQTTKLIKTISSGKIFQETCLRHRNVFTDFRTWETDCKVIPVGCFSYGIVFSIRIQMRVRIRGVRNVNISEDFAYVLNEWSQYKTLSNTFVFYISQMLYIYKRKSSFVNKFYQQKKFAEWHVQFHAQKTRTEIIPKHLVYPIPIEKTFIQR